MTSPQLKVVLDGVESVFSGTEVVLGRDSSCHLVIVSPTVSTRHARFALGVDGWAIEDLGSRNGTFVEGQRITTRLPLTAVTEIRLADVIRGPLLVVDPGVTDADRLADTQIVAWPERTAPVPVAQPVRSSITIGRAGDNTVVLDDPLVSRYHARVDLLADGSARVVDLSSANGTYLAGQRLVGEQIVRAGHRVTCGATVFRVTGTGLERVLRAR